MIKCNRGTLEVRGDTVTLLAEATVIISKLAEVVSEDTGKTKNEVMKAIVSTVKKADKIQEGK